MSRIRLTLATVVLFAAIHSAVLGAEAVGVILSVDATAGTVTLDTGETFILTDEIDRVAIEIGQRVVVTHQPAANGLNAATKIEPLV